MKEQRTAVDVCDEAAGIAKQSASELRLPSSEVQAAMVTAMGVAAALEASKPKQK